VARRSEVEAAGQDCAADFRASEIVKLPAELLADPSTAFEDLDLNRLIRETLTLLDTSSEAGIVVRGDERYASGRSAATRASCSRFF